MEGDLFCNAGNGDLYLRVSGHHIRRKVGVGWSLTTVDQLPPDINWSPLHYKQFDTMVPYLIKEGLLPENVQFAGERPAPKASEQGLNSTPH
ncbi:MULTISPECIES: hypothetical protein [unclassified Spirosoma]|uniref:hypothetical protein n=1 Tax=unclassified Spirosoma TaxID=2621999 RepID=UPI0009637724|nr:MULTISPECIES: hypothetical protein [unclassified Spirosoma]MBN8821296.1 hypothetical protein [Spirosoma sp.]OJW78085.1 MAG: hypothetical protein BGO59_29135 [Spirosoma sp. 48-14]